MTKTGFLFAVIIVTASASQAFARGGQAGPIGPGSRDGLTPSARDNRADRYFRGPFAYERPAPVIRMKSRTMKRK